MYNSYLPMADLGRFSKYYGSARRTWLKAAHVYDILENYRDSGLHISTVAPSNPSPGDIYLFDKEKLRRFRKDGLDYIKKVKHPESVREDFHTLLVDGKAKLQVSYAKANPRGVSTLDRRVYKRTDSPDIQLAFVHYLPTKTEKIIIEAPPPPGKRDSSFDFDTFLGPDDTLMAEGADIEFPLLAAQEEFYNIVDFAPSALVWERQHRGKPSAAHLYSKKVIVVLRNRNMVGGGVPELFPSGCSEDMYVRINNLGEYAHGNRFLRCIPLSTDSYKIEFPVDLQVGGHVNTKEAKQ